jgi:hypothetical protein
VSRRQPCPGCRSLWCLGLGHCIPARRFEDQVWADHAYGIWGQVLLKLIQKHALTTGDRIKVPEDAQMAFHLDKRLQKVDPDGVHRQLFSRHAYLNLTWRTRPDGGFRAPWLTLLREHTLWLGSPLARYTPPLDTELDLDDPAFQGVILREWVKTGYESHRQGEMLSAFACCDGETMAEALFRAWEHELEKQDELGHEVPAAHV